MLLQFIIEEILHYTRTLNIFSNLSKHVGVTTLWYIYSIRTWERTIFL